MGLMGQHTLFPNFSLPSIWVQNILFGVDTPYWLILVLVCLCMFFALGTCWFGLVFTGPHPEFKKSGSYILHSSSWKWCLTLLHQKHLPENVSEVQATLTAFSISPVETGMSSGCVS